MSESIMLMYGLLYLFLLLSVTVRYPLFGTVLIVVSLVLPLPKVLCPYVSVSPQCGVQHAFSVSLEADIPIIYQMMMAVIVILILLGMEQSRVRGDLYDLEKQISFYMSYHNDAVNKAIHLVCIPLILWSAIGIYSYTGPIFGAGSHPALDWSAVFAGLYAQYYMRMAGQQSTIMGLICFMLVTLMWAQMQTPYRPSIGTLGWVHALAWILQFWGHGVHEKRAPALLTNLSQALLMAPMLVFLEACFALGWQPELHERVTALCQQRVAEFSKPSKSEKSS